MVDTSQEHLKMTTEDEKALAHRKPCTVCNTPRDVLVRCQIDESGQWHFVCPGACWKAVSGGVIDGDDQHIYYRYGGMWKNKHAGVSAKKPKSKKTKYGPSQGATSNAGDTSADLSQAE